MGRLGFNLVREKEPTKNVENGIPDQQQNERNESVEVGELLVTIDAKNRLIKNLRILLLISTALIICLMGFIFTLQWREYNIEKAQALTQNLETSFEVLRQENKAFNGKIEALEREFDATWESSVSRAENLTAEALKEKEQLARALKVEQEAVKMAGERYEELNRSFKSLEEEREALAAQLRQKVEEALKLTAERDELAGKLEEGQRKLQQRREAAATAKTTAKPPRGLFDSDRLRRIDDIVKDIETGGPLFDIEEFMRKTDEVFRL